MIDYRRDGLPTEVSGLDGPQAADGLYELAERRGAQVRLILVEADHEGMRQVADLVEAGQLRATVAATFPLDQAAKAHELGETNRTTGKIVLTIPGT